MKKWISVSSLLLLSLAANAFASQLSIPSEFEFLAVDGNPINSSLLNRKSSIKLAEGEHKVAMRFNDLYEDDITGSHGYIKSYPFIVSIFVDGLNQYQLAGLGSQFNDNPDKYAKNPKITIRRVDNGKVVYSVKNTQFNEGSLLGEMLGGEARKDVKAYAVQQTTVHKVQASTQAITNEATAANVAQDETMVDNEAMLKYWWNKADVESRQNFLIWLQTQNKK